MITVELELSLPAKRLWQRGGRRYWFYSAGFRSRPNPGWHHGNAFVRLLGVAIIVGYQFPRGVVK